MIFIDGWVCKRRYVFIIFFLIRNTVGSLKALHSHAPKDLVDKVKWRSRPTTRKYENWKGTRHVGHQINPNPICKTLDITMSLLAVPVLVSSYLFHDYFRLFC